MAIFLWRCTRKTWCITFTFMKEKLTGGHLKGHCMRPEWTCLKKGKNMKETKECATAQSAWKYLPMRNVSGDLCLHSSDSWVLPQALRVMRTWGISPSNSSAYSWLRRYTQRHPCSLCSEAAEYTAFLKHKIFSSAKAQIQLSLMAQTDCVIAEVLHMLGIGKHEAAEPFGGLWSSRMLGAQALEQAGVPDGIWAPSSRCSVEGAHSQRLQILILPLKQRLHVS